MTENIQTPSPTSDAQMLVRPTLRKTSPFLLLMAIGGIVVAIALLIMAGVMYFQYSNTSAPNSLLPSEPVACTMDAMICPDGTAVGRTGPNCEFAPCPVSDETSMRACPRDTLTCADGTQITRTGPLCEFVCSLPEATSEAEEMPFVSP